MAEVTLPAIVDGAVRGDGRVDVLLLGGGLQQGEGLFETLPVESGHPHFLDRHARRLARGADELELAPAPDAETWGDDLALLCQACGSSDLAARLMLFRDGERVRRGVAAQPLSTAQLGPAELGLAPKGLLGPRPHAHMKTLNYLGPRRAHAAGVKAGYDEVLFLMEDGTVLEGSRSTVFMIAGGVVRTAPLDLPILPGVTREVLLEICEEAGTPVREEGFSLEELTGADEAFLAASLRGVRPVSKVRGQPLPAVDGPVTRELAGLYRKRVRASNR